MDEQDRIEKQNLAFGGLVMICFLADHPDTTDQLMLDLWHLWMNSWVWVCKEYGMSKPEVLAFMKELFAKLEANYGKEDVETFGNRMNRLLPGIFGNLPGD